MNIAHFFIDRPIFSCVTSLVILLAGGVAYFMLPVEQFPNIVPPTVVISTSYPGASAETLVETVATPIEKQVNGVDNMLYMSTSCTSDGSLKITVTFKVGTDPDMATVLVQNRVNVALPKLPDEVSRQGVLVKKQSPNMIAVLNFYNPQDKKDYESGKRMTEEEKSSRSLYLGNFVVVNIKDQLARAGGVGDVSIFNTMDFAMRIWLNPDVLAARNISVSEITSALRSQNIQVASGRIGQPPVPEGTKYNIALTTQGRLGDSEEFGNIVLRTEQDGGALRLRDVAVIELGASSYASSSTFQGIPGTIVAIYQNPGENAIKVAENVLKMLQEMDEVQGLFGNEIAHEIGYDATQYVRVSLKEVEHTLIECVVIVILVVFFFLQDWRAALIPTLAVPVALVGCFFLMWTIGFTINSLTLFGLILVIGIVVDDAIIVVENTQRLIDEEGLKPYDAARKAMSEVTGPILATTLVLMSIFIPTSMVPGITGEIYRQFALTIAGAVAISALCALTLAPALAAILLRKGKEEKQKNILFRGFNYCFNGYRRFYLHLLKGVIAARWLMVCFWFGILVAIYGAFIVLPNGFIPNEDQGVFFVEVRLPEGASAERTKAVALQVQKMFDNDLTGIQCAMIVDGFSMLDGAPATNSAFGILTLLPWEDRYPTKIEQFLGLFGIAPKEGRPRGKELSSNALVAKWMQRFSTIPEAIIMLYQLPPVAGLGTSGGVEYQLLDRGNKGIDELYKVTQELLQRARETGNFSAIQTTFSPYAPRYYLDIDRDKVQKMGVAFNEVFTGLQGNYGSIYVNDFNAFNNVFPVFLQAHGDYRNSPEDVLNMRFKNSDGKMVPIRSVAEIREVVGPQRIPRFQMYTTAYVQGQLVPGVSTGQGMQTLVELSKDFPQGFGFNWTGMSFQEAAVGSVIVIVFALCVTFAFLVLAAQYESWTSPLIILMAVPLAIGGALLFVALRGIDVNIYTQVGFILMVGFSAKNAILITEFATERRRHGKPVIEAAYEAGCLRLRPIMMTSFAFILGMVPLITATGAGEVSRHAIGTPVFGGVLTETMIGVYTTPVLFVLLTLWSEAFSRTLKKTMGRDSET